MKSWLILLIVVVLDLACSPPQLREAELLGNWVMDVETSRKMEFHFSPDHSCSFGLTGETMQFNGHWTIQGNTIVITMQSFGSSNPFGIEGSWTNKVVSFSSCRLVLRGAEPWGKLVLKRKD